MERESHSGAGLGQNLRQPRGAPTVPEGLHPVERNSTGAVHGELQPMQRTHVGEVNEGLFP